ncbi:hypothetical protein EMIT079MI2_10666 [Bacillus sp. IT-79MI2]
MKTRSANISLSRLLNKKTVKVKIQSVLPYNGYIYYKFLLGVRNNNGKSRRLL